METISEHAFHLSYMEYNPLRYNDILFEKAISFLQECQNHCMSNQIFPPEIKHLLNTILTQATTLDEIQTLSNHMISIIQSPKECCRQRVRFGVKHLENNKLAYVMWEGGSPSIHVKDFPIASAPIRALMPILLEIIEAIPSLSEGLQAVHYLSSTIGDVLISLIYNLDISIPEKQWEIHANQLLQQLHAHSLEGITEISMIGRSKKHKVVLGKNYVVEQFVLNNNRTIQYKQVDDGFSNPNGMVNLRVLNWLSEQITSFHENTCQSPKDLLEMFCGNGNHTVALSGKSQPSVNLILLYITLYYLIQA